ncbi:hypothetical protein LEP1GSC058_2758 [Leptospira fainei serovar Hurstbridge str. BUT 6]|uniref:Uncharacterized protein n=1 Tax=Leptospira fainei serovar Hurstbridge str. BUT 6 TaxID=1193011 RepID=S3UVY6_9LEPT|nr:hypothetical protein [Leptospira fainei]EPG74546.1 hypothetical protein LEP1GSC058_2758 [Leptospira fainei serovar Hurstbridge str. BUT 6]
MRNVFAYLAAASIITATAVPVAEVNFEEKLLERMARIYEELLSSEERKVNAKGIAVLVREAKKSSEETRVMYAKAQTFAELLDKALSRRDQEFLYGELSLTLSNLAPKYSLHAFHCPTSKKGWIAKVETVRNPYLSEMREIGEKLN